MEDSGKIKEAIGNLKEYFRIQRELLRLELTQKIAEAAASVATVVIIGCGLFMSFVFLSVGLGFYFSHLFHSKVAGFLALGGLYVLITVLLLIFREKLIRSPLENKIIEKMLNNKDSQDKKVHEPDHK